MGLSVMAGGYSESSGRTEIMRVVYDVTKPRRVRVPLVRLAFASFAALCVLSCAPERGSLTSQMSQTATPYLTRAARQPVIWQKWSRETFTLAARLDRPILLTIGAVNCRACAAMDRETYASGELGAMIDSLFVPVRVDRDERPDIAQRYGIAVQVLTGLRGYPLTVFLTPEGSAFFGGTYFPPDDPVTGRGMKQILLDGARSFRAQRSFITHQAALVRQLSLNRQIGAHGVLEPGSVASGVARVRLALAQAVGRRRPLASLVYEQAAALVLDAAARGSDSSERRAARGVLDLLADSGGVLAPEGELDELPGVVRAGMARNLAVGWALLADPRYRAAAHSLLASLAPALRGSDGTPEFADRAGYVIGSALESAAAIGDSAAQRGALAALEGVLARHYAAGWGIRHAASEGDTTRALLGDQVQVASACLAAYNASREPRYLRVAVDLAEVLDRDFADSMGGYFDASRVDRAVPAWGDRTKPVWDDLLPGANAWAARVLLQLADATGEPGYRRRAEATLEAFAGMAPSEDVAASTYLAVALAILSP